MRGSGAIARTMAVIFVSGVVLALSGIGAANAEVNQTATETFGPEDFLPLDPGSDQADVPTETYGPEDFLPLDEEPKMADVPAETGEVLPREATPPAESGGAGTGGSNAPAISPAPAEEPEPPEAEVSDAPVGDAAPTGADLDTDESSGVGSLELAMIGLAGVLIFGALAFFYRSRRRRVVDEADETTTGALL